jgi:spore germination protein YaaH
MRKKLIIAFLAALVMFGAAGPNAFAEEKDLTTRYRVYQNANLLQEFASKTDAINYARKWAYSYVEEIGTRAWVWSQFPKYEVSQNGVVVKTLFTLEEAIKVAEQLPYAAIRHVESGGWVWNNYPKYRLYQGEITLDYWEFATLEEAQQEAKRWANAHVIALETNKWVWDNISEEKKAEYRARDKVYKVYQGKYSREEWEFAYLEDAIAEAVRWENSYIVNTAKQNKKVYSNENRYTVYQYDTELDQFEGLEAAIAFAKKWDHARIMAGDREIWNNYPYYIVSQNGQKVKEFNRVEEAVEYARSIPKATVTTIRGTKVWDNSEGLRVWAWNGSMTDENVMKVVSATRGLDVNLPTWFKLLDADGNVEDKSSPELVRWLHEQGLEVHPLIHNQFDGGLTGKFLANPAARKKFIDTIVNRSVELGVDGLNLDFESLRGSDRNAFTQFVKEFGEAARAKGLTFSIDLPRGSIRWNHQTAFDHAELHKYVDYIVIMAYDQYYSGSSEPGSVSGLDWAEEGIQEFLSYGIPRDKLIMGIPFYIRQWKLDAAGNLVGNNAIYSYTVPDILAQYNVTKTWDERFGQYKMEYKKDGFTYVFWLEDAATVEARLAIARKYSLAGVSAWRLGQEDPSFWDTIAAHK